MSVNSAREFETLAEILAAIHEYYIKNQAKEDPYTTWDCVAVPGIHRDEYDDDQDEWSDAAYRGDWEALFRVAVRGSWDFAYGRFANCTRLLRKSQDARTPSRYTALHQAAWHGAPVEIVQGLIELGASCGLRSTDGKHQRPIDIAREKRHTHLYSILSADLIPEVSDEDLAKVETHFHALILEEARGVFDPETMRLPDLGILRDQSRVSMQIPGMYGGFSFKWKDGHLVSESYCRIVGGSGRTNHITPEGANLVDEGWG